MNQSLEEPTAPLMEQPIDQSMNNSVDQSLDKSVDQSMKKSRKPINELIIRWIHKMFSVHKTVRERVY